MLLKHTYYTAPHSYCGTYFVEYTQSHSLWSWSERTWPMNSRLLEMVTVPITSSGSAHCQH